MIDFKDISYLKQGSDRQVKAYDTIRSLGILHTVAGFDPIVVGTIPIGIDILSSDIDIICWVKPEAQNEFENLLISRFGKLQGFSLLTDKKKDRVVIISSFSYGGFEFEIYGDAVPTERQNAYRHMLIENYFLCEKGEEFRSHIIDLKLSGMKTEPAFAKALDLSGDPYRVMLDLADELL